MEIDIVLKPEKGEREKRKEIELIQKEDTEMMESYRGLCMKLERLNDD